MGDLNGGHMPTTSPTTRRDPVARAALLDRWQRRPPGQSRAAFCRLQRVKPWTLAYLLRQRQERHRPGFVELVPAATSPTLEVVLGGARIRLGQDFDPALLRRVVAVLGGLGGTAC
jgi:hypothetical protein